MDQMMIDVNDVPNVQLEDEVIVFSHENGAMNYYEAAELTFFNRNGCNQPCPAVSPKSILRTVWRWPVETI